jgi:hypothetical protein
MFEALPSVRQQTGQFADARIELVWVLGAYVLTDVRDVHAAEVEQKENAHYLGGDQK